MIRRASVVMLTVRVAGQSKPMLRFRRQTRAQFKPSHHPKCSVGPARMRLGDNLGEYFLHAIEHEQCQSKNKGVLRYSSSGLRQRAQTVMHRQPLFNQAHPCSVAALKSMFPLLTAKRSCQWPRSTGTRYSATLLQGSRAFGKHRQPSCVEPCLICETYPRRCQKKACRGSRRTLRCRVATAMRRVYTGLVRSTSHHENLTCVVYRLRFDEHCPGSHRG